MNYLYPLVFLAAVVFAGVTHAAIASSGTDLARLGAAAPFSAPVEIEAQEAIPEDALPVRDGETGSFIVPFYSQVDDITPPAWKSVSCGVASLAMLIDFYRETVSPDTLLEEGLASGAYIHDAGWSHQGLINLASAHGLRGYTNVMHHRSMDDAFIELEKELEEGPVIVSVQYTFTPTNPIPHLVVITGVHDGMVYYADPADGTGAITIEKFQSSWKKRYIAIRPLGDEEAAH